MGYPNPAESVYDLFMTGHAGCSVATALGLQVRRRVAPARREPPGGGRHRRRGLPFGHRLRGHEQRRRPEARNCSWCSTTTRCRSARGWADWREYLDRLRMNAFYTGLKSEVQRMLGQLPMLGDPVERLLAQVKERSRPACTAACCSRSWVSATSARSTATTSPSCSKYLEMVQDVDGPGAAARGDAKGARLSSRPRRTRPRSTRRPRSHGDNGDRWWRFKKSISRVLHRRGPRSDSSSRCEPTRG